MTLAVADAQLSVHTRSLGKVLGEDSAVVLALRFQVAWLVQQYLRLEAHLQTQSETSQRVPSEATQQAVTLKNLKHPVDSNVLDDKLREDCLEEMIRRQIHAS